MRLAVLLTLLALLPASVPLEGPAGTPAPGFAPSAEGLVDNPGPPSSVLLVEVLAHAPRDNEYVALANAGNATVDLGGWWLTDGEGSWTLPGPLWLEPDQVLVVAQNATALWEDGGLQADVCLRGCDLRVTAWGTFALRNGGDEVILRDSQGDLMDVFVYGDGHAEAGWQGPPAAALERGKVARRLLQDGGYVDTNASLDWTWPWDRTFRLGESRRPAVRFEDVEVHPFLAPEGSLDTLLAVLASARREIVLAAFTFTHEAVAGVLQEALARGVRVQVGVEGSPPGGRPADQDPLLDRLAVAGARVLVMGEAGTVWRRYAFHHAKYAVVDGSWVVLGSENFSPGGFPADGRGNRGWGLVVRSSELAAYLLELTREDWDPHRSDVTLRAPGASPPWPSGEQGPDPFPETLPRASVQVLLSPDNAVDGEGLLGFLQGATASLDVQLLYLRSGWRAGESPLVGALLDAARRGVTVRVLLDGGPHNVGGPGANDGMAAALNDRARQEGLPLHARLLPTPSFGMSRIHNKGVLVDGRAVLVGSANWNYHGAYENREVGLVVESPQVARVFQEAFDRDWDARAGPLTADVEGPRRVQTGEEATYTGRAAGGVPPFRFAWDLHGDGRWDGEGPAFSLPALAPGRHVLVLRVEDARGDVLEVRATVTVLPGPPVLPPEVPPLLTGGSGLAAVAWWWVLRTRGERTNKREDEGRACPAASRSPPERSRSTRTAPSTGGSTGRG